MAFSETQLTALETAIGDGALSVQYGERKIIYHSLSEMIRLRDTMRSELGIAMPATSRARFINMLTGKGL